MQNLPATAGAAFKPQHFRAIEALPLRGGFFEVHAENYMGAGGPPHAMLEKLRTEYALSIHGVGLSIGGAERLDAEHLSRLKTLCERYAPQSFSEHLAWSSHGGEYFADLLPLPYTRQTLARIAEHIDQTQDTLGREMLLENPATYVRFAESELAETEFLAQLSRRTGCGLLLDVNNVYVCAHNHGFEAEAYLRAFPMHAVREIHLAGHFRHRTDEGDILIDTHGAPTDDAVWALYAEVIERAGPIPTLIEWDNDVPDWPVLRSEALRAQTMLGAIPLARSA